MDIDKLVEQFGNPCTAYARGGMLTEAGWSSTVCMAREAGTVVNWLKLKDQLEMRCIQEVYGSKPYYKDVFFTKDGKLKTNQVTLPDGVKLKPLGTGWKPACSIIEGILGMGGTIPAGMTKPDAGAALSALKEAAGITETRGRKKKVVDVGEWLRTQYADADTVRRAEIVAAVHNFLSSI